MGPLLITAGRVYDGVADRALERASVVVDRDTITGVGPQTELEGHTGRFARVIDLGAEATVLPGLINMHTHMSLHHGSIAAAILTAVIAVACGYAAMTLIPTGMSVLTVE